MKEGLVRECPFLRSFILHNEVNSILRGIVEMSWVFEIRIHFCEVFRSTAILLYFVGCLSLSSPRRFFFQSETFFCFLVNNLVSWIIVYIQLINSFHIL